MTLQHKIREFWDDQATIDGAEATSPDRHYRSLEIREIAKHLRNGKTVLDMGCGNGYSTRCFANGFIGSNFIGADYSPLMISQALEEDTPPNVSFLVHDVLDPIFGYGPFDTVISERCMINLTSWEAQKQALLNLKQALKVGGKLILVENTLDGLRELNWLRTQFGLHEIKVRWHNQYLDLAKLRQFLGRHFTIEHEENIGNLYYIISRVAYAAMARNEGKEPEYGHVLNEVASMLPTLPGPYSPNYLWVAVKSS